MASARFRLGTAATNSAGTTWSWRSYDAMADVGAASYVKIELESNAGVSSFACSIPAADEATMSAGVPTVTTNQATKTATFRAATGASHTYLVRCLINSGTDNNGDAVAAYDKRLAVHRLTPGGHRLIAVGERDEADRTYGYTRKFNAVVRATTSGGVGATVGGDLSGSVGAAYVVGIYGKPLLTAASNPASGVVLRYTGAAWEVDQNYREWRNSTPVCVTAGQTRTILAFPTVASTIGHLTVKLTGIGSLGVDAYLYGGCYTTSLLGVADVTTTATNIATIASTYGITPSFAASGAIVKFNVTRPAATSATASYIVSIRDDAFALPPLGGIPDL